MSEEAYKGDSEDDEEYGGCAGAGDASWLACNARRATLAGLAGATSGGLLAALPPPSAAVRAPPSTLSDCSASSAERTAPPPASGL